MTLIVFWYLVAEKHRVFQQRSLVVVVEIETLATQETRLGDLIRTTHERPETARRPSVRQLRTILLSVIALGWLVIVLAFAFHGLP